MADDIRSELDLLKDILENSGKYKVKTASNPDKAMELLQADKIRVAILDYRLNSGDEDDDTGLFVAQNSSREIPKIMVSARADEKQIRAAFGVDMEGRMIVFDFLSKDEIRKKPAQLLKVVERAVNARALWDQRERESVKGQLLADYRNARRFDLINTGLSFLVNLIFIGLLIFTINWMHAEQSDIVLYALIAVGIIVSEVAINLFLAKRIEGSSRRAENYHTELLQAWRFEQLLKSADNLDYVKNRNQAKQEVITAFANRWNKGDSVIEPSTNNQQLQKTNSLHVGG